MSLEVGEYVYNVCIWQPGQSVLIAKYGNPSLAIDTETEMIVPGEPIVPVLMQVCCHNSKTIHVVEAKDINAYLPELLSNNPSAKIVMHNAPFDLNVLGIKGAHKNMWLRAIREGRVVDTGIRYMLRQMSLGREHENWGLDNVAMSMLRIKITKDEDIRLTFKKGMEITQRHLNYAAADSAVTAQLFYHMPTAYPTEDIQLLGAIALHDIGQTGMYCDIPYLEKLSRQCTDSMRQQHAIMTAFGFHSGEPGNRRVLQNILNHIESELRFLEKDDSISFLRTAKTANIQITDDSLSVMGNRKHPFIEAFKDYEHNRKIVSTYLNRSLVHSDNRVHPYFSPLKRTGRSSCRNPNIQNIKRDGGIRGVYIAPPGHVLYVADYDQAELCSLAQSCLSWYGASQMAEVINTGNDLHKWFAGVVLNKSPEQVSKDERQMAKACNFGFPGGLGIKKFQIYAKDSFGVPLTEEQSEKLKNKWLSSFPEMEKHLSPPVDQKSSKYSEDTRYIARTLTGRIKRNSPYCAACNYVFQGLTADGAKIALYYLFADGYRTCNFIHDEIIVELKEDENLQKHIARINHLMVMGMKHVLPDINVNIEGALMRRWYKEAKPKYGKNNELLVWEPA